MWLEALPGAPEVLRPDNAQQTCSSGKGRLLDFAVVSREARACILRVWMRTDAPFRPHSPIQVDLAKYPAQVRVPVMAVPRDFQLRRMEPKRGPAPPRRKVRRWSKGPEDRLEEELLEADAPVEASENRRLKAEDSLWEKAGEAKHSGKVTPPKLLETSVAHGSHGGHCQRPRAPLCRLA